VRCRGDGRGLVAGLGGGRVQRHAKGCCAVLLGWRSFWGLDQGLWGEYLGVGDRVAPAEIKGEEM